MSNDGNDSDGDDKGKNDDENLKSPSAEDLKSSNANELDEDVLFEELFDPYETNLEDLPFADELESMSASAFSDLSPTRESFDIPEVFVDFESKTFPPKFEVVVWDANFTSDSDMRLEAYLQRHLDGLCHLMKNRVHNFFHGNKPIEEFNELEFIENYDRDEDLLVSREALRGQLEVLIQAETKHLVDIDFLTYDAESKLWDMVVLN